ncbi:helix-turn-helix domain-containing protein [Nitrincola schmidtii]|uniref:helix-turn-helix domain-containing protein n=1 Tax=Nitrincola schmidtii TaxID=1730894 RepID=UPI00124C7040|nr:helix-turn-helix domain-containing protein [Nitrincola schmidtii]
MQSHVSTIKEIGELLREVRKAQQVRQDDLGAMVGCSHKFIVDVEKGKETIQAGLLLKVLDELGIKVILDLPETNHVD